MLCAEGPARIRDLIRLGVAFDQHNGELARGLEAAHTRARVLHAGGDSTGLTIELALARAVRAAGISVMEHTFACDLILRNEQVAGLQVLDMQGDRHDIDADAVILASGGAGQLYLHTTNPAVATGDGVAMALRAGAQLADLEFYQFHPTALATPGTFLISEAVRGTGAVLLDAKGRRFMQDIHTGAETCPTRRGSPRHRPPDGRAKWPAGHARRDRAGCIYFSPSDFPPSTPPAVRAVSTGPRHPSPSPRPHTTGWAACAPIPGAALRSLVCLRSARSPAPACTEPTVSPPTPCSKAWSSPGAAPDFCSMKM